MSETELSYFAPPPGKPFANGYAHLRFKALTRAMRALPLDASALEITTKADSLLYDRYRLVVNPDGSAFKDPHWNDLDERRRRKGEKE